MSVELEGLLEKKQKLEVAMGVQQDKLDKLKSELSEFEKKVLDQFKTTDIGELTKIKSDLQDKLDKLMSELNEMGVS